MPIIIGAASPYFQGATFASVSIGESVTAALLIIKGLPLQLKKLGIIVFWSGIAGGSLASILMPETRYADGLTEDLSPA